MDEQMPELVIPRNEKELCELFGDFLFMNTEKFPGFRKQKVSAAVRLNTADLGLFNKTGVVGRMFRRWFQTTWGVNTWSTFFDGETPRQELGHHYTDFVTGDAMLSVEMEERDKEWQIVPRLFLRKDIVENGGVFTFGLKNIKSKMLSPSLDFGFEKFAEYMLRVEMAAKSLKSYDPPENEEEKWWKLFWAQIGASLAYNIHLELPPERLIKVAFGLQECIDDYVLRQGSNAGDFLEIDDMFGYIWRMLTDSDKRLLSYAEMMEKDERIMDRRMSESNYLYSTKVFYHLGHMFDERMLFPADKYFGGVECVWTDHQNFLGAMQNTLLLLKNHLVVSGDDTRLSKEEKRQMDYMGIADTALNIERTWFAPPTVFRLLPSVTRYL